uniref:F-box domain-containing protein n=1 Tax=Mycena chlorophos TaxID=658473 RepID=A0ABQ0LQ26_MYCCL|nr:predicted protein [Mycena chlorophos]
MEASAATVRRAAIDARLAVLEAEILELKIERNTLSPISRLSAELLVEIFSYLAPALPADALVHVCRRWHELCMGVASLWACIHLKHWAPDRLLGALELSGTRPVEIGIASLNWGDDDAEDAAGVFGTLFLQSGRIASLEITGRSEQMDEVMSEMWSRVEKEEFPVLEFLTLQVRGESGTFNPEFVPLTAMPRLASLTLVGVPPNPDAVLPELTTFSVRNVDTDWGMAHVLRLLRGSPKLQYLTIENLPELRAFIPPFNSPGIVHFPALERLDLRHSPQGMSELMRSMEIPPTAQVVFVAKAYSIPGFANLLEDVKQHTSKKGAPRAACVSIDYHPSTRTVLDKLVVQTYTSNPPRKTTNHVSFLVTEPDADQRRLVDVFLRATLVPAQLDGSEAGTLENLLVQYAPGVDKNTWAGLLKDGILRPKQVWLMNAASDRGALALLDALADTPHSFDVLETVQVRFPRGTAGSAPVRAALARFVREFQEAQGGKLVCVEVLRPKPRVEEEQRKEMDEWAGVSELARLEWKNVRVAK